MMEKLNQETSQCYCYKCPLHQTGSPAESDYVLAEIHRPAESVPVIWCEDRPADRMEECERCPKPCAGMYRMTLGGINQIQHRRKGRPSPSSSSCNAEGQRTSMAVRTGRPRSPVQSNDGVLGSGSSRDDRQAGFDVACQTNIRSLMSPRDNGAGYPRTDREGKTCEAAICTDTSNHLKGAKDKNSCHRDGSYVRQFAVFTLLVGVIGYLAINHQKHLNRQ
ncbi:uncharacterized protein LOC134080723 isoform X2 [Sardina pilchardus]|uniref:uncharacterized protein LOC134080723 isoform X2 n=1 Tax=Sardina pilchardus TaxID=27697 RepID=UPI002E145346